jgi:hypothetical protein
VRQVRGVLVKNRDYRHVADRTIIACDQKRNKETVKKLALLTGVYENDVKAQSHLLRRSTTFDRHLRPAATGKLVPNLLDSKADCE